MKDNEKFYDLESEIRSLPEPNYEKSFTKETQDIIHRNVLQFASSYYKKKKRVAIMSKISVGLVSVAAIVLFAILTIPINGNGPLKLDLNDKGQQSEERTQIDENKVDGEKNDTNENKPDKLAETILYENKEYGFIFTLPKSWDGYQIVSDTWEGIDQQQSEIIENGQIILIRHPEWTQEKPRQDIPIMIFTHKQWSSLEQGEYHIGAAPIGPAMLGENNEYVFALSARYNFALLDGYKEVESILENKPLQPKNVEKD